MPHLRRLLPLAALLALPAIAVAESDPKPDADGWYSLFNGKDLSGWKKTTDNPDTFQVVDGKIVAHGPRCHIFYVGPVNGAHFKDFEWKCEILTKPGGNSGMYFHTRYQPDGWPQTGVEVQINNSHADPRRTGSVYRVRDVMNHPPAKDNEWFTQHVIWKDGRITVKVNGKLVNKFDWPEGFKREKGWEGNVPSAGTFALQGHDPGSEVHFRKILIKPLP